MDEIMDPRTRLTRTHRVTEEQMAGSRVLLDPDNSRHYALDELSGRLWELCDGSRNVGEVIGVLQDELDGEPEAVERDVRRALADLHGERLLVVAATSGE